MNQTKTEIELNELKEAILDMMILCKRQLEKAKDAFMNQDKDIANDIIHHETKVNAMELSIDREIENIFALYGPKASDLRSLIAMLKMNSDLERIGDYSDSIADYVVDMKKTVKQEAMEETSLGTMFDITVEMMDDITTAFETEDTALARKVYKKDADLNEINSNASNIIGEYIKKDPEEFRPMLFLFSTIRKLERVGDHIKNVAEDMIFHHEAEILKHKGKRAKE